MNWGTTLGYIVSIFLLVCLFFIIQDEIREESEKATKIFESYPKCVLGDFVSGCCVDCVELGYGFFKGEYGNVFKDGNCWCMADGGVMQIW